MKKTREIAFLILCVFVLQILVSCRSDTQDTGNSSATSPSVSEMSADVFSYDEISGGLKITGYTGMSDVVSVPSVINNKKVIELDPVAFSGNVNIREVILPETISGEFELDAFLNCDSLEKLTFCGKISKLFTSDISINTLVFESVDAEILENLATSLRKCSKLTNVVIGNIDGFDYTYFTTVTSLLIDRTVSLTLPDDVVSKIKEGEAYKYIVFTADGEPSEKFTVMNVPAPIEKDASERCNELLKEAFLNRDFELNEDCTFFVKYPISYAEHTVLLMQNTTVYEGEEYLVEFEMSDSDEEDYLYPAEYEGYYMNFDSLCLAQELSDNEKLCIVFGCKNVIVNGEQYNYDFE